MVLLLFTRGSACRRLSSLSPPTWKQSMMAAAMCSSSHISENNVVTRSAAETSQPTNNLLLAYGVAASAAIIKNGVASTDDIIVERLTANQTITPMIIRSNEMIHRKKAAIPTHFLIWHSSGQMRFCRQRAIPHLLREKITAKQNLNPIQCHHHQLI